MFQKKLDEVVSFRSDVQARLEMPVQTLDQLNSALHLLEELRDMENKIDSIYLPIESMYDRLRLVQSLLTVMFFHILIKKRWKYIY